jgi:hypothetical protein
MGAISGLVVESQVYSTNHCSSDGALCCGGGHATVSADAVKSISDALSNLGDKTASTSGYIPLDTYRIYVSKAAIRLHTNLLIVII